jgi:hypothetical protein
MALSAVLARAESNAFADRLELISASPVLQAWCSLDVIVGQVFSDIGHKVSNSLRGQCSGTLRQQLAIAVRQLLDRGISDHANCECGSYFREGCDPLGLASHSLSSRCADAP